MEEDHKFKASPVYIVSDSCCGFPQWTVTQNTEVLFVMVFYHITKNPK